MKLQLVPVSHLPVLPSGELPGFPECSRPPAAPAMALRVSPKLTSSGYAVSASSSFPESCSYGRSIMTPRLDSNFASSAETADESSRPTGSCTSLPESGCIPNFNPTFHLPASRLIESPTSIKLASSCQAETAFPIPSSLTSWIGA
jgi:hypothetical protein